MQANPDVLDFLPHMDGGVFSCYVKLIKPDPEIYNKAAELLGIEKEGLMIIEDSLHGVMAGKASGIFTVAYKGAKFKQDTPMADLEICDFKELNI